MVPWLSRIVEDRTRWVVVRNQRQREWKEEAGKKKVTEGNQIKPISQGRWIVNESHFTGSQIAPRLDQYMEMWDRDRAGRRNCIFTGEARMLIKGKYKVTWAIYQSDKHSCGQPLPCKEPRFSKREYESRRPGMVQARCKAKNQQG
jgi:hypothetical protein